MNEITVFNKSEVLGQSVNIYGTVEEPLFLAKDVAEWIEYDLDKIGQMLRTVDDDEKLTTTLYRSGQNREMWFLTEDGLYEVLMQSRKPKAKIFKTEVKKILKSIRKHGAYMTPAIAEQVLNNPDFMIELLQNLKAERAKVEEMKPKALFYDTVADAKNAISMREAAKVIGISGLGQNKLFQFLKDKKLLMDNNQPYQEYINRGYFRTIEQNYTKPDGSVMVNIKTLVTQRGLDYIIKLIEGENKQITCAY